MCVQETVKESDLHLLEPDLVCIVVDTQLMARREDHNPQAETSRAEYKD